MIFGERGNEVDSTRAFADAHRMYNVPHVDGTFWHASQFSHLVTYGGTYYSYLWCQRMSQVIYEEKFHKKKGEDLRAAGEDYWKSVLRHGGSKDPFVMVKDFIGKDVDFLQ